eukprot:m.218250 g.218250  ORF g.218250 m.218250 type:complete len:213 (+) comp33262_c0_seq2:504-1142(+)
MATTTLQSSVVMLHCDDQFYAIPLMGTIIIAGFAFIIGVTVTLAVVLCCCRKRETAPPPGVVAVALTHSPTRPRKHPPSNASAVTVGQQQQRQHSGPIKVLQSTTQASSNAAALIELPPESGYRGGDHDNSSLPYAESNTGDLQFSARGLGSFDADQNSGRAEDLRKQLQEYSENDVTEFMENKGPQPGSNSLGRYKPTKMHMEEESNDLEV